MDAKMDEIVGRYVEVDGHRLFMDTAGDPKGIPMLCLHTAGKHALQWRFVLPYFAARGYYVIAPDLPGHGKSLVRDYTPINSIHTYAELMWQLLAKLGLKRPVVMGCSIGGDITLDIAAHHSAELRAAIPCEAAARTPTYPLASLERGLEDSAIPSFADQGYLGGLSASGTRALPERVAEIAWTRRIGDPKIHYNDLVGWINHDVRDKLAGIRCPVAVVWGDEDYFVPYDLVRETVEGIPGAQLIVMKGIGHYPHVETPEFNELVERFLRTCQ
jgi:pimeloyl-ACP methyl ester carboxylesterase